MVSLAEPEESAVGLRDDEVRRPAAGDDPACTDPRLVRLNILSVDPTVPVKLVSGITDPQVSIIGKDGERLGGGGAR